LKRYDYRRLLLGFAVVMLLLWASSRKSFFADTISSPFLAIALFSVFLILLRTGSSWKEISVVAGVFLALASFDLRFCGYPATWPAWASFLGIASLAGLAFRVIWSEGAERRLAAWTLGPAFLFVASEWMASYFLEWTERAHPKVLDLYLYSFDASLHVQLPFVVGRLFARYPGLALISFFIYIGLPIGIGLTYAGCLMRDRRNAPAALVAFLVAGPLGILFYNFLPALGPIHVFLRDFPWHPLTYEQGSRLFLEPIALAGPRNAIPSLHAAWIFLVFWYVRNLSLAERVVAGIFVLFTLSATLGTGEHYFVDIVVAVPFSLLVIVIADLATRRRWRTLTFPLTASLGLMVSWIAALRFAPKLFWLSPVVPWGACLATLLLSCFAFKKLPGLSPSAESLPLESGTLLASDPCHSAPTMVSTD
jgi:hypothetical protein